MISKTSVLNAVKATSPTIIGRKFMSVFKNGGFDFEVLAGRREDESRQRNDY